MNYLVQAAAEERVGMKNSQQEIRNGHPHKWCYVCRQWGHATKYCRAWDKENIQPPWLVTKEFKEKLEEIRHAVVEDPGDAVSQAIDYNELFGIYEVTEVKKKK